MLYPKSLCNGLCYKELRFEFTDQRLSLCYVRCCLFQGNIRVFCRVRPLVGEELYGSDGEIQHMNFPDEDQKVLELEKLGDVSLSEVGALLMYQANTIKIQKNWTPEKFQ